MCVRMPKPNGSIPTRRSEQLAGLIEGQADYPRLVPLGNANLPASRHIPEVNCLAATCDQPTTPGVPGDNRNTLRMVQCREQSSVRGVMNIHFMSGNCHETRTRGVELNVVEVEGPAQNSILQRRGGIE